MSVYRDDLIAARERIRALEGELQSMQRREAASLQNSHDLVRAGSSHSSTAIALVGVLITGFVALRVPAIAPVALVAVLLSFVVLALRGRSIVVRPNEVAVIRAGTQSTSAPVWVGPGRVVHLRRGATADPLSLRAVPVSWTAHDVATADGRFDVDMFAVVAVRRDEEGIERAVRTFGTGPLAPITQAALEDALRRSTQALPSAELRGHDARLRDQLRRKGRESLDELGVKLVSIGTLDVRAHGAEQEGEEP